VPYILDIEKIHKQYIDNNMSFNDKEGLMDRIIFPKYKIIYKRLLKYG
jgi:hypothetical protein